jgi:Mu-like prophage protein gp29
MATIARKDKKDNKGLVINTLVVRKLNRSALDVGQWRTALKAADNDRRQKLYDLYEDILLDPVLSTSIEKRINAITNAELRFMKDEKPLPEMEDLIDSPVFEELLTEILNARFWGKSVIELDFSSGRLQVYNIPRQHIYVQKGLIVINPGDEVGIPYRGDDFFLEAGKDKEFGQILRAAPYVIYKRGDFGDWAEFAELFGMPFKKGSYSAQDDKSRELLEEALELSGGKSWIVHPKETDIELVESKTSGNGVLYDLLRKACNEEILISILGQTMTTINGSSKSQSETHKEVEESINKADRRFVQRILNTELLPRLEKRGYPVNGGWFTFIEAGESLSMMDMMEIHTKFKNDLKLEIDDDFLYDTYGIPRPEGVQKRLPLRNRMMCLQEKGPG